MPNRRPPPFRQRPQAGSGRYQIRYPGPDGRIRTGPETYERKTDAERALVLVEAQIAAGGPTRNAEK